MNKFRAIQRDGPKGGEERQNESHETPANCPEDCTEEVGECEDYFACEDDKDCVKSQAGCCPCSSGGQSIAVAAACEDEWLKAMNCPPDIMCLTVYLCDDSVAACNDGKCLLVGGEPAD